MYKDSNEISGETRGQEISCYIAAFKTKHDTYMVRASDVKMLESHSRGNAATPRTP